MSKFQYKNTSDKVLILVGVGIVAPGGVLEADEPVENPHLEEVKTKKTVNKDDK